MNGVPYIVGQPRKCVDCGKPFPRKIHRRSYCEDCRRRRNRESMARHAPRPNGRGNYRGKLPGGTRLSYEGMPNYVMRKTKVAQLPTCPICHAYNRNCEHGDVIYG